MNKENSIQQLEIEFAGVTLSWLYENIRRRSSDAFTVSGHQKFLAARHIQTMYRGWRVRQTIAFWNRSARTIQRVWRGFLGRRTFYQLLEELVQQQIENHYRRCATLIQSFWRGYWSRIHIHDHYKLKRAQLRAAKELIHCVAFKLHYLLRTHQIPGVYSLRNSRCFSKVEKLLASLRFKEYNERVRRKRKEQIQKLTSGVEKSLRSQQFTEIPFEGPSAGGDCIDLYNVKDADRQMFQILDLYAKKTRTDAKKRRLAKKVPQEIESDFCTDVVNSMKRWNILSKSNVSIAPDVVRSPENIENFVEECRSVCEL